MHAGYPKRGRRVFTLFRGRKQVIARLFVVLIAMAAVGCDRPQTATTQTPSTTQSTRPAEVPLANVLTLATKADMEAAADVASDPAVQKAIGDYVGNSASRWEVVAARSLGDFVLLWVSFPDVADGGIDLVYSKKEQRIKWEFKGGERG